MNVRQFVERRKPRWERFEQMVQTVRWAGARQLNLDELNELGRLYRQVAADLAYARQQGADPVVQDYLNSLLAQAHGVLYRSRRGKVWDGLRSLYYGFPESVRRQWRSIMWAIVITLTASLTAFLLVAHDPVWSERLVQGGFQEVLEHWKRGKQYTLGDLSHAPGMSMFYFVNNSRVALLSFGLGIFAGIPTVYLLWTNGMILGVFAAELARVGKLGFFLVSIYPHGVPELGAIFFCAGAGLLVGRAVVMPGDFSRVEAVRRVGQDVFYLVAGSVVLILIAGLVEAFFSFYAFPNWMKFAWGTLSLGVLLTYIVLVRRR